MKGEYGVFQKTLLTKSKSNVIEAYNQRELSNVTSDLIREA